MAKQATHNGECQICGRTQKLPGGVLSKHGYTVSWGFFNGVCSGAGFLPFEQDNSRIAAAIEGVTNSRDMLVKRIGEIQADTSPETAYVSYYIPTTWSRKGGRFNTTVPTSEIFEAPAGPHTGLWVAKIQHAGEEIEGTVAHRTYGDDNTAARAAYESNQGLARKLEADRKQADDYIAWQTRRNRDWAPRELKPINK